MTATIAQKSGMWYAVIQWRDAEGKQIKKWRATGFPVKGNHIKEAKSKAEEIRKDFERKMGLVDSEMLFSDYLFVWLDTKEKYCIKESTYSTYRKQIENCIAPYFSKARIKLCDLTDEDIERFYMYKLEHDGVKAETISRYHANLHKALDYAVKTKRVPLNPCDTVTKPKGDPFVADYYTEAELGKLLDAAKGSVIETPIYLAALFGLRRGECIGLRWSSIDFDRSTLIVNGVIKDKGKGTTRNRDMYFDPMPKTKASIRTLPMPPVAVDYLRALKMAQEQRKKRKGYNHTWDDFVCVRPNGDLIPLENVTRAFPKLCQKCGLKPIRFHELRHSNISLLLSQGLDMKRIQLLAGHSDIRTTMNKYGHLQVVDWQSAEIVESAFSKILK